MFISIVFYIATYWEVKAAWAQLKKKKKNSMFISIIFYIAIYYEVRAAGAQ